MRRVVTLLFAALIWGSLGGGSASAQLGALISPGPLARPHDALDGIANCEKCHERGRKVPPEKCLACHAPVATRVVRKAGIHKDVKDGCVMCHAEHAGADGVLRPFDERRFDHAGATGFALTGKHAPVAGNCAACHKTRSFLTLVQDCASCHRDVHNGRFGKTCTTCHSARTPFKEMSGQFDHSRAAFKLTGSHASVACAKCHVNSVVKGIKFAACTNCHRDPHTPTFGQTCTSCHSTAGWRTNKVDHDRTGFPLRGRHTAVNCVSCHRGSAVATRTTARLAALKGAGRTCASCHKDIHLGQVSKSCENCHSETSFVVRDYRHAGRAAAAFFVGRHLRVACATCHKTTAGVFPAGRGTAIRFAIDSRCTACHSDVHRGSLGPNCLKCHKP